MAAGKGGEGAGCTTCTNTARSYAISLRAPYDMSGTDRAYDATSNAPVAGSSLLARGPTPSLCTVRC
eukprot:2595470-Rhodomonas_salina.1